MPNTTPSTEETFEIEELSIPRLEIVLKFPPVCVNCLCEIRREDVGYFYFEEDDTKARALCQLAVKRGGRIAQMMNDGGLPVLCNHCSPEMSVKALDVGLRPVDFKLYLSMEEAEQLDQILKLALLNICQDKPALQLRGIEMRRLLRIQSATLPKPDIYWTKRLLAWNPPRSRHNSDTSGQEGP